eukprot:scaffold60399_cov57-Phaeocystis_antarctica.AAC.3
MEMRVDDFAPQANLLTMKLLRTYRAKLKQGCGQSTYHVPTRPIYSTYHVTTRPTCQPTYRIPTMPAYLPRTYQANLQQRRGRAGRVRTGLAIHLVTSHRLSMYAY